MEILFTICPRKDCQGLEFIELTGTESATNPTGWPAGTDTSLYTGRLDFYKHDGSTALATYTVSPTRLKTLRQGILFSASGTDKLSDGAYKVIYTVTGEGNTYTVTKYVLLTCNAECSIRSSLMKAIDDSCDCCEPNDALNAQGALLAAVAKFNEGLWDDAESALSHITNILRDCNC